MNRYGALFIFLVNGRDEGIEGAIEFVTQEIVALGGTVHTVQKMDKRKFERVAHRVDSGYYVYMEFSLEGSLLGVLNQKLKGYPKLFRQFYVRRTGKRESRKASFPETIAPSTP
ncbi:30S ribosomal protein S6 [Candidatus Methylacidithermus pantelleriae]|uniref:Small ribosomal subunit protein bS6 n=1 Tax=Candidatus Methylacidithermus pantelleriae TaxID=2744239 RepID=A0A8J2BRH3_9BACT|nr:30S ribosomal protein S6 [Candidatus Methylacidithermus pantelleriae]CAF0701794.1 30S ribosomal protein S6 [Candidatus Methylacidithermus pantelleriae]